MKKVYRVFALLAAMAMLGGCGGGGESSSESESSTASSTDVSQAESSETADAPLYPVVTDGSITLEYWMPLDATAAQVVSSYAENTAYQKAQEVTGINIEFIHPTVGEAQSQFNLLIVSGDLPDMIQYAAFYSGGVYQGYEDGAYVDLTPYLEECAPDYYALINEDEDIHREVYKNDKVITFERTNLEQDAPYYRPMVRSDWLEEFGMDVPRTLDDYEAYFQAILDNKPDADPAIINLTGTESERDLWMGAYDMKGGWYVVDGVVTHYYDNPNLRDFLTKMNEWYEAGYISRDFAALTQEQINTLFDSGQLGMYSQSVDNQYSRAQQLENFSFTSCPNPRLTEDQQLHNGPSNNRVTARYSTAITSSCENIEAAVKFLNYGYTDEGILTYNYGVEGEAWNMVDGEPQYTDLMLNNPDGLTTSQVAYIYRVHFGPKAVVPDTKCLPGVIKDQESLDFRLLWSDDPNIDSDYSMPVLTLTAEETQERADIIAEVSPYVSEMMMKFITGAESLDNFDTYLETLNSLNFPRAKEITQAAYDRYMEG